MAALLTQFADRVVNYSSEYGNSNTAYSASNLAGPPRIHQYGDFTEAFVLVKLKHCYFLTVLTMNVHLTCSVRTGRGGTRALPHVGN